MPPLVLVAAQFAIQYGIPAARELIKLFRKEDPTDADFDALWAKATVQTDKFLAETKDLPGT